MKSKQWIETEYKQYKGMIKNFANQYHQKTGLPFDDLEGQATLAFVEACHIYDPTKGQKQNIFYTYIQTEMRKCCSPKNLHNSKVREPVDIAIKEVNQEQKIIRQDIWAMCSPELKFLINLLLNNSEFDMISPCQIRKKIKQDLRKAGWAHKLIKIIFNEGTELVQEWT